MPASKYPVIREMTPDLVAIAILAEDLGQEKSNIASYIRRHNIKAYTYATLIVVNKMEFMAEWAKRQLQPNSK